MGHVIRAGHKPPIKMARQERAGMKRNVVILDHYRDQDPVQPINPWSLAFVLSGWIWAAIWFVAWVVA